MRQIRGIMLNAWLAFLRENYGESQVNEAIGSLAPEYRAQLKGSLLDASWYPIEMTRALSEVQGKLAGRDQNASALGAYMSEYAFKGAYKVFLTNDPLVQAKKIVTVTEYFYKGVHKLEVETVNSRACLIRYRTLKGTPSPITCQNRRGWWARTLEMAGARKTGINHEKCMANGADCCEFEASWESVE